MTTATPETADPDAPTFTVTERDMLGALQLLALADEEAEVQYVLSDEELLALDGPDALRVLGSPYLDQDGVDRDTAAATALRGLIARRIVNPTDQAREDEGDLLIGEGDPTSRMIQLERGLAGLLALRRIPEAMVIIERMASEVRTTLGLYFFPDDGVLEEFTASDGFHHFTVPTRAGLAARLTQFVDPHDCAATDGEVEEISVAEVTSLEGLEDTRALSTITSIGGEDASRATIFALSDRLRVVDNGPADDEGADPSPETALAISDVSPDSLREILETLLPELPTDEPDSGPGDEEA